MSDRSGCSLMVVIVVAAAIIIWITVPERSKKESEREILRQQKNQTASQVNVLADRLKRQVDDNGRFMRADTSEVDVWGKPIRVTYEEGSFVESLHVASNGPDGLPFTKDDIGITWKLNTKQAREEKRENRERGIEGSSAALTKGLVKGVFEGMKKH